MCLFVAAAVSFCTCVKIYLCVFVGSVRSFVIEDWQLTKLMIRLNVDDD